MIARIMIDDGEEKSIVERLLCPRNRPVSSEPIEILGLDILISSLRDSMIVARHEVPGRAPI